jgi:O-antigen ligase
MSLSERLAARNFRVIGFAFLIALCVGVAAGIQPRLGVAAALGVTFAAVVIADVTVGLFLFTILSFLEVVNAGSGAVSFIKVAGLILFLSWFAAQATRSRRETRSLLASSPGIGFAVVGFVSWSALSVAWADSSGTAIGSTSRFVLDALLFPIVFGAIRRREHFQWIVAAFVIGAVMSAVIGLLQSGGARLAGGIGDPDGEAALLAAALMLDVGLIATLPRDSAAKTLAVIGALIMGLGLLDTGSRGGFVALAAVLVAAVVLGGRWRGRAAALVVIVAIVTPVYLFVLAPSAAVQHLSSSSSSGRTDLWKVGLKMFEANPIAGVGSGNFTVASIHYVQQAGDITRADLIVDVPHAAHNTYLEIIDELGIPGFLMFMTIVIGSISAALRAARIYERRGDKRFELMSRGVALAVIALLTADFFITNEYEHLLWLLLALPPALLAVARSETGVRAS